MSKDKFYKFDKNKKAKIMILPPLCPFKQVYYLDMIHDCRNMDDAKKDLIMRFATKFNPN